MGKAGIAIDAGWHQDVTASDLSGRILELMENSPKRSAMTDAARTESVLRDVVFMEAVGMRPVIVHGGGKAISAKLAERHIFIDTADRFDQVPQVAHFYGLKNIHHKLTGMGW